ncbi:MAG: DUF4906 domain-containing protein [Rikenellaceae bacterium]
MRNIAIIAAFILSILTACQKDPLSGSSIETLPEAVSMSLNLSVADMNAGTQEAEDDSQVYAATKSTITKEPSTEVKNLWVLQFAADDGRVVGVPQYIEKNPQNAEIKLVPSDDQTIVYVANTFDSTLMQSLSSYFTIDEFKSLTYAISEEESNFKSDGTGQYMVLFGEKTQNIGSGGKLEACELIRNVAQITVKIKVADDVSLSFTEAAMIGVPAESSYCPNYESGDNFPADDSFSCVNYENVSLGVADADGYQTVMFYVPVNMRGEVNNANDAMKNNYATASCTAIALLAENSSTKDSYIYTFYLGENLTDDFNIKPNTKYTYTLDFNTISDPETDIRMTEISNFDYSLQTLPRSNCYILNPLTMFDRKFTIPIDRIDEFWGNSNYCGTVTGNTLSDIEDNWEAVILWHDYNGSFTYDASEDPNKIGDFDIVEDYANKNVKVTLPKEFSVAENHCNVVYVVRKKDDKTILWTWHLWITDYNPYPSSISISVGVNEYSVDGGALHFYNNTYFTTGIYGGKLIMDRNIGARSANPDGSGYGLVGASFNAPGTIHYQYGRNAPFPARFDVDIPGIYRNGYALDDYSTATNGVQSFANVANSPNKFFITSNISEPWCSEEVAQSAQYIWFDYTIPASEYITGKSIFDPSPLGFKVPTSGVWNGFTCGSAENEYANPDNYNAKLIYNNNGVAETPYSRIYKDVAFYPALGYRGYTSGGLGAYGTVSYQWSATPSSNTTSRSMYMNSTVVSVASNHHTGYGFCVRPIQE